MEFKTVQTNSILLRTTYEGKTEVEKLTNYNRSIRQIMYEVSSNPTITLDFVEKNSDLISWHRLTYNSIITLEFIEKHINKDWYWFGLTHQPCMTMDFIQKYPTKNWDWPLAKIREERNRISK